MKRSLLGLFAAGVVATAMPGFGQDSSGGWRRFDGPPTQAQAAPPPQQQQYPNAPDAGEPGPPPPPEATPMPYPDDQQVQGQAPVDPRTQRNVPYQNQYPQQGNYPQGNYPAPGNPAYGQAPYAAGPVTLTLTPGSWITVRVNEPLSSEHNQSGDAFTATLAQPLIVNGRVIARRGQTIGGRVVEVKKAGRVSGTSSLRVELTELSLADGQQVPIKTQLIQRNGSTSVGRDAAAIGTTTGVGAAIGAAVDGGFGAGMGAIGGALVSTVGVLVTRGRPTVLYPEMALTFRVEAPVTVTGDSYAFAPATQQDFGSSQPRYASRPQGYGRPGGYPYYGPYAGGYGYPGYGYGYGYPYPYFYGPSVFFYGGGYGFRHHR